MVVERLSFEHVEEATIIACEHLQRYEWAARLVRGRRVLDLCCGVGFGSLMLAETATEVVGVDVDADAVDTARAAAGDRQGVAFEVGDALEALVAHGASFDAIVCFEGLEHLHDLEPVADQLARISAGGARLLLSVPNSRMYEESNEFHVTDFDVESAQRLFGRFEGARTLQQYVAEGALLGAGDEPLPEQAQLAFAARTEPAYATTFLCATNVADDEWSEAAEAVRVKAAPVHSRWLRNLEASNRALWGTNRALGRQLGELARQLDSGEAPLSASRMGAAPAGSLVGRLEAGGNEALRHRVHELEQELVSRVDALTAEVLAVGDERNDAERRYRELRSRRVVRGALKLRSLLPRRR